MSMDKLEQSLPLLLLRARETVMSYFRPVLQEYGITEQQWRVLRALYEYRELEPKQLSRICTILAPSLTGVVSRLEQNGFILRRRPMEDQRRTLVSLSPGARVFVEDLAPDIDAAYQRMCEEMSPERVNGLTQLCKELEQRKPGSGPSRSQLSGCPNE